MRRCVFIDNFLPDPAAERARALAAEYKDEEHNGLMYPGIALAPDPKIEDLVRAQLGLKGGSFIAFFRRYLPTEEPVTFIHNDSQIGAVSGILFLTDPGACKGGLAFWKHRLYGWERQPQSAEPVEALGLKDSPELWRQVHRDGFEESRWEMVDYVDMRFNRLVLFDSLRYHSRYPQAHIGDSFQTCRLIKTFFFAPEPPLA